MIRYSAILGLAAGLITLGDTYGQAPFATAQMNVDLPTSGTLGHGPGLARPAGAAPNELSPIGNPLWAVPLESLSRQRERPIFSSSRRPPRPPAPTAVLAPPTKPPPPRPAEPELPPLSLVGTIVGKNEGIGIFFDRTTRDIVRIRTGQAHAGWILRAIRAREATLDQNGRMATLALPPAGAETNAQFAQAATTAGVWMDGDGQMIRPPPGKTSQPRAEPADQPTRAAAVAGTWIDGDGQMIRPPPGNASQPTAAPPPAAAQDESDAPR
jgi:hypothetical protein